MFKPMPDEARSQAYFRAQERELTVSLDMAGLEYIEENIPVVNEVTGAKFKSFEDMCEREPRTAYGFLRSALLHAIDTSDIDVDTFLPPREHIDLLGRKVIVAAQLTEEDKRVWGEQANLPLHSFWVGTDKRANE